MFDVVLRDPTITFESAGETISEASSEIGRQSQYVIRRSKTLRRVVNSEGLRHSRKLTPKDSIELLEGNPIFASNLMKASRSFEILALVMTRKNLGAFSLAVEYKNRIALSPKSFSVLTVPVSRSTNWWRITVISNVTP